MYNVLVFSATGGHGWYPAHVAADPDRLARAMARRAVARRRLARMRSTL